MVRYKHIAIYFCTQIVLEKNLFMGMSMVKALILKIFRVRRKDTPTTVMCTHFHHESVLYILHVEEREQEKVAKEVRGLKSCHHLQILLMVQHIQRVEVSISAENRLGFG